MTCLIANFTTTSMITILAILLLTLSVIVASEVKNWSQQSGN